MTNKAYIVTNEQQEITILRQLEEKEYIWLLHDLPTTWIPSRNADVNFPYVLIEFPVGTLIWDNIRNLGNEEIVFDGRKEEKMSEKYVVSQVFMNELMEWKSALILEDAFFVNQEAINNMPKIIKNWWVDDYVTIGESNKRLISIIRYMSGANDFEVEKPKKWVVRSKETDYSGKYGYIEVDDFAVVLNRYNIDDATNFDTKEEAESWANSHQEVVEVVDV